MAGEEYNEKYIEEKFKGVTGNIDALITLMNSHFKNVDEQLDRIEHHAEDTNSKVTHAEDDIRVVNRRVDDAEKWAHHIVDTRPLGCPNLDRVIKIEDKIEECEEEFEEKVEMLKSKLEDVFFVAKYPKLFLAVLVAAVLLSLATFLTNEPFRIFGKDKDTEYVNNHIEQSSNNKHD